MNRIVHTKYFALCTKNIEISSCRSYQKATINFLLLRLKSEIFYLLIFGGKYSIFIYIYYCFPKLSILCPDCAVLVSSKSSPYNSIFVLNALGQVSKSPIIFDVHINCLHFCTTSLEDISSKVVAKASAFRLYPA